MLIILNGPETIHRKWFGLQIAYALNTFVFDGYTVDFGKKPMEIFDPAGKLVYGGPESEHSILHDENGDPVPEKSEFFNSIVQQSLNIPNEITAYYKNLYCNISYDAGASTVLKIEDNHELSLYPHEYPDLIGGYTKSKEKYSNYVISGAFSKGWIDQIKSDLGAENVHVVNIVRNPSCVFLTHVTAHGNTADRYNQMLKSLSNSGHLSKFEDIQTLKFEDIIAVGSFEVNGVTVNVPPEHVMFNQWLTEWEYTHTINMTFSRNANELSDFNALYADRSPLIPPSAGADMVQINGFEELGYTPLDYPTITLNS